MTLKKAVITAAAPSQRTLPLQRLVDRDGVEKTALQILIEEVADAGIEEVAIIICPGDEATYFVAAGELEVELKFFQQDSPRGYGDALYQAADFVGNDLFVHLVSDHIHVGNGQQECAQQLVKVALSQNCSISAVQPIREHMLPYYGVVGGRRLPGRTDDLYLIEHVVEKPTPTFAEETLVVPGLRAGHYLCLFGMHVLTPTVMEILGKAIKSAPPDQLVELSPALAELAKREEYLAMEVSGRRFNIGVKYGIFTAQLALGLAGRDRDEVLAGLVELLASSLTTGNLRGGKPQMDKGGWR